MNINLQTNTNVHFKAVKVANTRNLIHGVATNIELYKLTQKDIKFLDKLKSKVSIESLCPKLKKEVQERWQKVLNYCIESAKNAGNESYVAISNGRLCGIITAYIDNTRNYFLDGVSAIPSSKGEKTPLAGTTLIYQIFRDVQEKGWKGVLLDAVHDVPVDVVKKYKELGFKEITASEKYTTMHCNKYKIAEQIENLSNKIDYQPVLDGEIVNLEEFFN